MVGLIEDAERVVRRPFRRAGDVVVLLGDSHAELGGSAYLQVMHGLIRGVPPALDLEREASLQKLLVAAASAGIIESAHDCAEGGFAVALAECCFDAGLGVSVDVPAAGTSAGAGFTAVETMFGESASRVVVSISEANVDDLLTRAAALGVPAAVIGRVGGDRIRASIAGRTVFDEPRGELEGIWATAIEVCFERSRAIA